jgi:hypothetical protein
VVSVWQDTHAQQSTDTSAPVEHDGPASLYCHANGLPQPPNGENCSQRSGLVTGGLGYAAYQRGR